MVNLQSRLLLVISLWAACFPLLSLAAGYAPHLALAAMRALLAGAALLVLGLALGRPLPHPSLWGWIAAVGLGSTMLGFAGMVHASEYVSPGTATVIANAQPIAAALIARLCLGEHLGPWGYAGLAFGFGGVTLIAAPHLLAADVAGYAAGMGYLLLAAAGVAAGNVIMKYLAGAVDTITATGLQLLAGGVPLAVAALAIEDVGTIQWSTPFVFVLMGLALAGTALPYWLWFSILGKIPLGSANAWTFLVAPLGLAIGIAFYGEKLTPLIAGGTGAILLGIWMTQNPPRRSQP